MNVPVYVHYLKIESNDIKATVARPEGLRIEETGLVNGRLNQFFYCWVGEQWAWLDKRSWTNSQWDDYAKTVRLFIIYHQATPVGYFELGASELDSALELAYFGLGPLAFGLGIGRYALEYALLTAKGDGAQCVTVNTCSWDHPAALKNYLARGFVEYRQEVEQRCEKDIPQALIS